LGQGRLSSKKKVSFLSAKNFRSASFNKERKRRGTGNAHLPLLRNGNSLQKKKKGIPSTTFFFGRLKRKRVKHSYRQKGGGRAKKRTDFL